MENQELEVKSKFGSPGDSEREVIEILASMDCNQTIKRAIMNVPTKYRLQYARALSSPTKRALAVKMKCYECVGFENISTRVGQCSVRLCSLWLHRPFQKEDEQEEMTE